MTTRTRSLLLCLLLAGTASGLRAQPAALVRDREKIFAPELTARLDSSLRAYHARSGRYVIVATDTADVSVDEYTQDLIRAYAPDSTQKVYLFALLMSRTHAKVQLSINKHLLPHFDPQSIREILEAGIPFLREKKPGEAAEVITGKMIESLDRIKE